MADQIFSVNSGFYEAVDNDRTYTADDMNRPYKRIVANGVFATQQGDPSTDLQVLSAGNGMQVIVSAGDGIFADKWFENPSAITITVPNNTDIVPRIDSVIVQVDERQSGRVGNIVYRTGTPASSPAVPPINQVTNVTEYRLANIYVAASANAINNDAITDLRGSSSCPWVTSLIQQVDTSTLWEQYRSAYQNYYDEATENFEEYTAEQHEQWEQFLSNLTDELEVATNVIMFTNVYTAAASVTTVPIGISSYDKDTDILMVYKNGLLAVPNTDYTINSAGTSVVFTSAVTSGQEVTFVVFHSVIAANIESTVTMIQKLDDKVTGFMADSGWINFYLESGVTSYNSSTTPGVRCIGNRVYLRGAIKNATVIGTTICTVPVSYRPAVDHVFTTSAVGSNGTVNDEITITISASNGTVKLTGRSGTIASTDKISIATNYLANVGNTISLIYTYKGSVSSYATLPSNPDVGDIYMVNTADAEHDIVAGDDVMWNGSEWEILNSEISSAEIDAIISSIS